MTDGEPEPHIVMITMDRATSSAVFVRSDGKEARFPMSLPFEQTSALSSLHWAPTFDGLVAVTQNGDEIVFELPRARGANQLDGRLVVYLDQKDWSAVARARSCPDQVNELDRQHAQRLASWVQERRIVLPMSSGHFFETTKWSDNEARYALGLAICQLSRGWQMRDVLQVRRDELYGAFRRWSAATPIGLRGSPVFTLAPDALYGAWRGQDSYQAPSDLPPQAAFAVEALVAASATIDVVLDAEAIEPGPEGRWTASNQAFSDWLDSTTLDSQQKRRAIDAFFLADLGHEIPEESHAAGLTVDQMREWTLRHSAEDIPRLPATGLYREVLYARHLNIGTTWRSSDLEDMVYLSCAAGYADFVICERHMRGVLNQGLRRLKRPQTVFPCLRDAIPAIEAALAKSAIGATLHTNPT